MAGVNFKPKAKVGPPTGSTVQPAAKVDVPDIMEFSSALAMPSIAVRGVSGTGKTHGVVQILNAGYNILVVDVENKYQSLIKHGALVIPMSMPVKTPTGMRAATHTEIYNRLMGFKDQLAAGSYRTHKGKPIQIIAMDGIMELSNVFLRHFKKNTPVSQTGEKNTFALWDKVGEEIVDYLAALKSAASAASDMFGYAPVGIYCTVGEKRLDDGSYKLLIPGNKGIDAFPYQFEAVLRLSSPRVGNVSTFVCSTVGEEGVYEAKCPCKLGDSAELSDWNMGVIYGKLIEHYQTKEAPNGDENQESASVVGSVG